MSRLNDKTVLVTGAAGAVGAAVVAAIADAGGTAIATDLCAGPGIAQLDVTVPESWQTQLADFEQRVGRLDGLVNAAGIANLGTIEQTELADWRRLMAVNLDGSFLGCKYVLPLLSHQGGCIINLGSVFGQVADPNLAAYAASKGGIRLLTKSVALDGARRTPRVRCNCISPAFLEGALTDEVARQTRFPQAARARMLRALPLGRFGRAAEVAELCTFLLSDQAGFVTGAEFLIDGGMTA